MYRCEATSVQGFVQQLAVAYVRNGYYFYVPGTVPEGKDPRVIDAKLIEKYGIDISKWMRWKRKGEGLANLQYIRFGRFFVLIATKGEHRIFAEEHDIRDVRRFPIRFAGYSIGCRQGPEGHWHPSVRIDGTEFRLVKQQFMRLALTLDAAQLAQRFGDLRFAPYAPVRNQYRCLLRAVNRRRGLAALELIPKEILKCSRCIVLPFDRKKDVPSSGEPVAADSSAPANTP